VDIAVTAAPVNERLLTVPGLAVELTRTTDCDLLYFIGSMVVAACDIFEIKP